MAVMYVHEGLAYSYLQVTFVRVLSRLWILVIPSHLTSPSLQSGCQIVQWLFDVCQYFGHNITASLAYVRLTT